MSHACAAVLCFLGGKEVNEDNVKKVLTSVGAAADENAVKAIVAETKGEDILALAKKALSTMSAGAPSSAPKEDAPAKKEEKKDESEESEEEGGFDDLFG